MKNRFEDGMEENKTMKNQFLFMKQLNLFILIYISVVTFFGIRGCIEGQNALEFLSAARKLPPGQWNGLLLSVGYYICLLILLSLKCRNNLELFAKVALEILVGVLICDKVYFGYAGVILLILADAIQYAQNIKRRIFVILAACVIYLLVDADLVSAVYPVIPLETMWMYYDTQSKMMLFVILKLLNALNLFVFIYYMMVLILDQMSEKKRILLLNEELEKKNEQLFRYAKEMEAVTQTKERNRLAREIHDTLGHALTGIITGLDACIMLMDVSPEATKKQLTSIADVARQGMTDVRRSIKALRPDALEKIRIKDAIKQMIEEMSQSTGVEIILDCDTELNDFTQDEEDVVYRIVQESITNSIRHGKASRIEIHITREYNILTIRIIDNGIGCKDVKHGFGLHHMKERLEMLKGSLEYDGSHGFMIEAKIPIRWGEEGKHD